MIFTIKNNQISVSIRSLGAEVASIKSNDREYLWQGDDKFWSGQAPLLFPLVGPFRSKRIGGLESTMKDHGFLKATEFELKEQSEEKIVLTATFSEYTLSLYPFKFEIEAVFELVGKEFKSYYTVKNIDDKKMVYSFGLHPAFNSNDTDKIKFEDYYIKFDEPRNIDTCCFSDTNGGISLSEKKRYMENDKCFMFEREYFRRTIIMNDIDFNNLKFGNKVEGDLVNFSFDGFKIFSMWQPYGAPFVCLEPWRGYNGLVPEYDDVEDNVTVAFLDAGDSKTYSMTIEIL